MNRRIRTKIMIWLKYEKENDFMIMKMIKNEWKWLKMNENDWKWLKMKENDWKWLKMNRKMIEIIENEYENDSYINFF